jgi:anaphase-promoting complex subunit 6
MDIARALTARDPSRLRKYTTICDKTTATDSLLLTACGAFRFLSGAGDRGLAFLQKAVEDSDFEICWLALIFVSLETGDFDIGLTFFKAAQRRFPDSESLPLFGATLLLRSGAPQLAWPYLQGGDVCVIHERGVAYLLDGEPAEAADCFRRVIAGAGSRELRGAAAVNCGHCLRRLGRFDQAIELYNVGIGCGVGRAIALAGIAFTYQLMGRASDAVLFYTQSLAVEDGQPFATRMLDIAIESSRT